MTPNTTFPTNPIGIVGIGFQYLPGVKTTPSKNFHFQKFPFPKNGNSKKWKFPKFSISKKWKFQKMEFPKISIFGKKWNFQKFPFLEKNGISKNFQFWEKLEIPKISIFFWKKFPWKFFPENSAKHGRCPADKELYRLAI